MLLPFLLPEEMGQVLRCSSENVYCELEVLLGFFRLFISTGQSHVLLLPFL